MTRTRSAFGILAVALVLAGCASSAPQPTSGRPQTAPARGPGPAVSPATYVATAASIDLFVIRSSELALSRSSDSRIRAMATELIAGHRGTAAQLSFAGRRLNLLPPASMLPQHQAMLDELSASTDFDRTYARLQRSVHGAALNLHSNYAARGSSPTLRPVARNAAAIERSHLDRLRRI